MMLALLALLAVTPPVWSAPSSPVTLDSRPPDAHEARVFGTAVCAGRSGCQVTFPAAGSGLPTLERRVPVSIVRGSFTTPGAREVLVTLCVAQSDVCEGVTLLRQTGGRWRKIFHTPGITPRACLLMTRADGRNQLACRGNEVVMYGARLDLVTVDGGSARQKTLLDGNIQGCGTNEVTITRLGEWRRQDVNGDRRADLVVDVWTYLTRMDRPTCPPPDDAAVKVEHTQRRWAL